MIQYKFLGRQEQVTFSVSMLPNGGRTGFKTSTQEGNPKIIPYDSSHAKPKDDLCQLCGFEHKFALFNHPFSKKIKTLQQGIMTVVGNFHPNEYH